MNTTRLLALALLILTRDVSAQSHGEAPPAKTAPAAAAHGAEPAPKATAAKKGPTVSRIVPVTTPSAAATGGSHAAPADHATSGDHAAPAEPAAATPRGYVAVGARPKGAAGAHGASASGKPKPVVSGAAALRTPPPAEHGGQAAAPSATPAAANAPARAAAGPHAAETHAAAPAAHADPAHAAPPVAAAPAARGAGQKPAKLATVHERLTAVLAGIRSDTAHEGVSAAQGGGHRGAETPSRAPRVALTWPGPRWQVAWPAPGRIALRWPQAAAEVASAAAVPPPHD